MVSSHIRSAARCAQRRAARPSVCGKPWRVVLLLLWALVSVPAAAITLASVGPLPGALEVCIAAGDCAVAQESSFDLGGIAAFPYLASNGAGYLVRYPVLSSSLAHDSQSFLDTSQDPPLAQQVETLTALSGSLWLGVQGRYARSASIHELVLYTDRVQPAEQRLLPRWGGGELSPTVLHFGFTNDALLASQAYRHLSLDPNTAPDEGSLQSAEPLLPCVADGCSVAQSLALVALGFTAQGEELLLHFVPQDRRSTLYNEQAAYNNPDNGFRWRRNYFVQAVPLPGTGMLTLFGVGLMLTLPQRPRHAGVDPISNGGPQGSKRNLKEGGA